MSFVASANSTSSARLPILVFSLVWKPTVWTWPPLKNCCPWRKTSVSCLPLPTTSSSWSILWHSSSSRVLHFCFPSWREPSRWAPLPFMRRLPVPLVWMRHCWPTMQKSHSWDCRLDSTWDCSWFRWEWHPEQPASPWRGSRSKTTFKEIRRHFNMQMFFFLPYTG